jgi:hypothetical protein
MVLHLDQILFCGTPRRKNQKKKKKKKKKKFLSIILLELQVARQMGHDVVCI